MKIKKNVSVLGLQPEIVVALLVASSVYHQHGAELVVTSGVEGKHGNHSHHYKGLAVDLRIKGIRREVLEKIINDLKISLGDQYQVIVEANHIHCEFGPA